MGNFSTAEKKRPRFAKGTEPVCPFCPGHEHLTPPEVCRVDGGGKDKSKWEIRVVPNLYPFAPIHEVIIDSPKHSESFLTLHHNHIVKLFKVYRNRFRELKNKGQVVIFYNYGREGAASLPHPHAQLAVVPNEVQMDVTRAVIPENIIHESKYFTVFIPNASGWPYEVWFLPKKRGCLFDSISDDEIDNLAQLLSKILKTMESLLGEKFPFNFHIYHAGDWYLRLIPRTRVLGGFEMATGVYVHSKSPEEAAKELSF